jgi:hypothetical protein
MSRHPTAHAFSVGRTVPGELGFWIFSFRKRLGGDASPYLSRRVFPPVGRTVPGEPGFRLGSPDSRLQSMVSGLAPFARKRGRFRCWMADGAQPCFGKRWRMRTANAEE